MSAGLSKRGKTVLFAAPVVLVVVAVFGGALVHAKLNDVHYIVEVDTVDGAALYQKNCAYCHGPRGEGNGTAAIQPRARSFGFDKFRFASSANAVPTDDDLMRVIKNGIPGSAMPKFDKLTDEECQAIMGHVRQLARAGVYRRLLARAMKEDKDDPDLQGAAKKVEPEVAVLGPAALPPLPPAENLANGRQIFDRSCAQCHGPLGKGDGPQEQFDDNKVRIYPRDLTTGTYKGGGRTEDIYARIYLGVPGTPMPATNTLRPHDLADLIAFVQSLAKK
jgi:mono/diheme cytochrome c family protein